VIVGKLLDVILEQAVDVPFEHRAVDVEAEFLSDVLVNAFGVGRTAHVLNTEELEVAFFEVIKTMTRDRVVDGND
jgi:Pyruvate/2-oxoacid:ferredoxin oxidoreductase gamma subunit